VTSPASIPALGGRATAELVRLIGLSFSPGEVLELAKTLELEVDPSDAARDVVRKATAASALPRLLESLAHARPLVEWPPLPRAAAEGPSAAGAAGAASDGAGEPRAAVPDAERAGGGEPASAGAPEAATRASTDAGAEAPSPPAPGPGPSAFWPGTEGAAARPHESRGLDPRILVAVAGLTLVAALLAFLAGRSLTASPRATAAPSASAGPRDPRPKSMSGRARLAVTRGLFSVAEQCNLSPPIHDDAAIFARAANDCGRDDELARAAPSAGGSPAPEASGEPSTAPSAGPSADGADAGAPSGEPILPGIVSLPPKPRPAGGGERPPREPTKKPVAAGGAGCVSKCAASHRACTATCGSEPQQASAYAQYQACQSRCLSAASSCKLGCSN
jgi:hypothetical protein